MGESKQWEGDILIDDFERNTSEWSKAGGISILHRSFPDTRVLLRTALAIRTPSTVKELPHG